MTAYDYARERDDARKADPNEGIDPRRVSAIDGSISDPADWQ